MRNFTLKTNRASKFLFTSVVAAGILLSAIGAKAQIGTWTKLTNNAPHQNMGVMLLLTDGTVICHNTNGGTYGTGWDKLTPTAGGSYINGTWTSIASMGNDRLFFPTQVLVDGRVFAAGGEYGAGARKGEVYDPVLNTWTATNAVTSNENIYDGNSQILPNGSVLVGPQIGNSPSFDALTYTPGTNSWTANPNAPLNHDEAAWLKLPDSSILFVGIAGTAACRYIPKTNTWVADASCPVSLYDPFGEEAGCAIMLPNGKAIFFGATGHNAIYTPSGNTSPGTWVAAADFPKVGGIQTGTPDAPAAMMVNGHILCAVSFIGSSGPDEFRAPIYFMEYNYLTNTFAQVTSAIPGQGGADSIAGASCFQSNMLALPDGNILVSLDQAGGLSQQYFEYTPGSAEISQGIPVINSIYQKACGTTYFITGKVFNGISEGAAYGDDWAMSTNYPLVRLTSGANVYFCKTTNWNRIGAVQTDSLEDTAQFVLPAALPAGTYTLNVVVNGFPSKNFIFNTYGVTATVVTNDACNGGSTGSISSTAVGGNLPYTYNWTPSGGTNSTATGLSAGTYTITVKDKLGCTVTASATITQPATALVVTTTVTNANCGSSNGKVIANVSGGNSPYTFIWAPSGGTNATASNLSVGTYTVTVTDANGCVVTASGTVGTIGGETVSIASITNIPCNGGSTGSITTTTAGGTAPYTYAWTPSGGTNSSATNLSAATYTVTVHDANGCVATASAAVTQPAVLAVVTGAITNVGCNGGSTGSITATPSGGTVAYTYAWTPSGGTNATASNLSAGTYTVTVHDAHGCSATASAVITQPTVLGVTTTTISATCGSSNGSATAIPTGGTGAYTYTWAPVGGTGVTASGLSAGTYTVTVHDANNCAATASATVGNTGGETVSIASVTNLLCNGSNTGSITTNTVGGTLPYTYAWTPSGGTNSTASNLSAGTYTVTVHDASGCISTASATITQPTVLAVSTGSIVNEKCNGNSIGSAKATASGGTGAYTYAWTPSGGTNATASNLTAGTYTITVKDANGCTVTASAVITQPVLLTVTTAITPATCGLSNGKATATPAGGTVAYTYAWAPVGGTNAIASNLSTGSYTVTVTDANGCVATASALVTSTGGEIVTVTGVTPVTCNGGNNGSITTSTVGGTAPYTYVWTPSGGTGSTASNLTAGTYTVTVNDANGCTVTASATITQPPALSVTPPSPSICSGGSVVLTASGAVSYSWSPGTGLSTTVGAVVTASPTITTSYTVTGTSGGCVTSVIVVVTVKPTPVISVIPPAPFLCSGDSVVLTASGATSYTWAPPATLSANNTVVVTAFPNVTTTYTVTGTSNGCSGSQTVTVTVGTTPTVSVLPAAATICSGNSSALTASGAATYSWSPAAGLNTTVGPNVIASPTVTTTYTVTGTTGSCSNTAIVVVTVNPTPTVTVSPSSATLCSGNSATLTASGATTYSWAPAAGLSSTVGATVTATPAVTTTYTITGTSGPCSSTAMVTITVNATPTVTIVPNNPSICSGNSIGLTASGATGYSWTPSVGLSCNNCANPIANPTVTTSYTVTGTTGGCSSSVVEVVTVNASPVVSVSPNATLCSGNSLILHANGAITYSWAPAAGLSATVGPNVTATPTVTTTYTVVGTKGSCTDSAMVTITVMASPTVTIGPSPAPICSGDSAALTASGATSYSWSPATGLSCTNCANPNASPGVTTTYTVTGTTGGCSDNQTVTVTVSPTPTLSLTPSSATLCSGGAGKTITASGATTYSWSPAGGLSATVGTNVIANPTVTTTYTVTGTGGAGCTATDSITITVDSGVVTSITGIDTICKGDSTTLTASGGGTYSWNNGATTSSITVHPNATATYNVTVSKAICSATASMTVVVNSAPVPVISQSGDTLKCTPAGMASYQWYRNGTAIPGSTTDTAVIHQTGTYEVRITNAEGCADSSSADISSLLGESELSYGEYINVYPNPTNGSLHIECNNIPAGNYEMTLTDVLGQKMYRTVTYVSGHYSNVIEMNNYAEGLYILTIKGNNSVTEKKILLSK